MAKIRTKKTEYSTYAYLALLNTSVVVMVAVLLGAMSKPQQVQALAVEPIGFSSTVTAPDVAVAIPVQPVTGTARRVSVPSIGIDNSVQSGSYDVDTHSWVISSSSAFHADTTVPVNNTNGSTLIYGHAEWPLFGKLPEVREGAEAYVYTEEGLRFSYVFESKQQIDPNDVSALTATGPPKLLLLTCSGAFDAYRTLVVFQLTGVMSDE
ncbi:MAG: sortase [Candidatus Microsaccharimonas sp.]